MEPLTATERADLNAWIAMRIYNKVIVMRDGMPHTFGDTILVPIDDYAGDWTYAGMLFDRYEFQLDRRSSTSLGIVYRVYDKLGTFITLGFTGPEAIAKAVRADHERQT